MSHRMMQSLSPVAALLLAGAITACGDARATTADDDFSRDLTLASTTVNLATAGVDSSLLGTLETAPRAAPEPAKTVVRGSGNRAVRSRTPSVRATPVVESAALEESDDAQSIAEAPVPDESLEPVAVAPRPTPPPVIVSTGAGDYGTGSSGGGIFGGGSGRGGVVIRGGGVDGDNCELHRGGRGGIRTRGPIYVPTASMPTMPTAPMIGRGSSPRIGVGGMGGVGGTRSVGTRRTTGTTPPTSRPESRPTRPGRSPRVGG